METLESTLRLSDDEARALIDEKRRELGKSLVILAHHYQRREIVPYGDFLGDSYALSAAAARCEEARHIVFCGVHFMAESADILTDESKLVYLPNPYAGCPMADMAPMRQVLATWADLEEVLGEDMPVPITYMNSAAELKAFTGLHGGLVCTSANAEAAFDWAYARGSRLFFLPDQHLGRNTMRKKGLSAEHELLWDPLRPLGGHTPEAIRKARVLLWPGHCHVHMSYTLEHIAARRAEFPDIRIIVHPECREELVRAADAAGSTNAIVAFVERAPKGAAIAIGTELNLVTRLMAEHPDKRIMPLSPDNCPMCVNMFRTSLKDLALTLDAITKGAGNRVRVEEPLRSEARLALARMLELGGGGR